MKLSRLFTSVGALLLVFGIIASVIGNNTVYIKNDLAMASTPNTISVQKAEDLTKIAYHVDDVTGDEDIKKIATNIERVEVFDGLTKPELVTRLNKSLKGVLAGKGELIATRCLKYGVDPYVAVGIMLLETGCNWKCSTLATKYNNFGGMKGSGGYMHFSSVDEGINRFINNLYKNYYRVGLNTPEKMNHKYAASSKWAQKVNAYVKQIKKK